MAEKSLLFKTDASKEVNSVQTLEPRIELAESLGASTVKETVVRSLARDKDGNLVVNPVLTDILNSEFVTVIRRGLDGKAEGDSWVTFASTSNAENGSVDPEHSLLVSLKDLEVSILIPEDVSSVTTEPTSEPNPECDPEHPDPEVPETLPVETLCKYYGQKIRLDSPSEQESLWNLVADREVRLHKNNGTSVSGKWALDLDRIDKKTPDVLHLQVTESDELLAIDLDPSRVQIIPVTFTPDDNQDVFKLILFIKPFDLRLAQKQLKISNSTATPAEAQFLRPWVIVSSVTDSVLTGGKGEGGLLKVEGLTSCVKAVDSETKETVNATVSVIPTHSGFNTSGTLDSVKLPSVPSVYDSSSQLKNLVENGLFTVKATVEAVGYESQVVDLSVCINAEDQRDSHLTIVLSHDALSLERTLVNGEASSNEVSCTSRHSESDNVVDATLVVSGVSGLDGTTEKDITTTIVDKLGASNKVIYIVADEQGYVSGYILVKCECEGYVTETIKLPIALKDNRIPDEDVKWNITWGTKPSITIPETQEGKKGDELEAVVSSLGLSDALVATTGIITDSKISDQWGNEEEVDSIVVGVVNSDTPVSPKTVDVVSIPADAYNDVGCWLNISIVTKSGLLVVKKIQATVTDNRSAE